MPGIGFDALAIAGIGFMVLRFAVRAIRRDLGRSGRHQRARDSRHAF